MFNTKPIAFWVYIAIGCIIRIKLCVYIAIGCIRRNALWVYIAIGCVMLHSGALALWKYIRIGYIMRNAVGTAHMLKTKPVVLWVHNASYIVDVSGNHDNSDTRVGSRKIGATILHYILLCSTVCVCVCVCSEFNLCQRICNL